MSRGRILFRAGIAAFAAIMLAGPGAAIFPSTLRWAGWIACPRGTAPMTDAYAARHHTDETDGRFWCVAPDGTGHERTIAAMGGLALMYFMGISVLLSLLAMRGANAAGGTRSTAPPRPVPADVAAKARELRARDRTLQAIKIVREATGMGLREAKDWVEALPSRPSPDPAAPPFATDLPAGIIPPGVEARARELLAQDRKIEAIKAVREASGLGLKEAKEWVQALPFRAPAAVADVPSAAGHPPGPADRLAELKRMLDAGLITAGEYEAKKSEILAGL